MSTREMERVSKPKVNKRLLTQRRSKSKINFKTK